MSIKMLMISLIGEQPIPNLLPIRHLKPDQVLMVCTGRERVRVVAEQLERLLPKGCAATKCLVGPYDLEGITRCLLDSIAEHGWAAAGMVFNLTGGTKVMSLAAYVVAAHYRASFIYLESERGQTRLYRYEFDEQGHAHLAGSEILPALITIDDHLRAHVGDYQITGYAKEEGGRLFEEAVCEALKPVVDEIAAGGHLRGVVEIDLLVRCGNQVGIVEVKRGAAHKKAIDQLSGAGLRELQGIYTQKPLVSDQSWHTSDLRELAAERQIELIELPSFAATGRLSPDDVRKLQRMVCKRLGREVRE